jgi:hypothetical protein
LFILFIYIYIYIKQKKEREDIAIVSGGFPAVGGSDDLSKGAADEEYDEPPADPPVAPPVAAVVPIAGLFAPAAVGPLRKMVMETRDGAVVSVQRFERINARPSHGEFRGFLPQLERHESYRDVKYARWVFIDFIGTVQVPIMFDELCRHGCDLVAVCRVEGETCCAMAHRTNVKKMFNLLKVGGIQALYTIKTRSVCNRDLSTVAVQILKAWLQVGVEYISNFIVEEVDEIVSRTLARQWESLTIEQCESRRSSRRWRRRGWVRTS